jgi:hypothetical protein
MGGRKCGKRHKSRGGAQVGAQGHAKGSTRGGAPAAPSATRNRHETAPVTTVGSLAIRPRSVDSHDGQTHVAQVEEETTLLLAHASIELSPAASVAAALLHLDEPRAHALLGEGSSSDKTDGWCLDTGATHHMTGRWEFFTKLDSDVRGSVKFRDASGMEIKGVGSVIFAVNSSEHRFLTRVYYIPALRNSIISLGQLDEGG